MDNINTMYNNKLQILKMDGVLNAKSKEEIKNKMSFNVKRKMVQKLK